MLQPDRLKQCRFWLGMLMSALRNESNWEGRFIAMRHLLRFLWIYTSLALGTQLTMRLQQAVDDVRNELRRDPPKLCPSSTHARTHAPTSAHNAAQCGCPAHPTHAACT